MILIDTNLLVYAQDPNSPHHARASAWLDERLSGDPRVGLPWECLLSYVRIVTNPRIFTRPQSIETAWDSVEKWLDCGCVWTPAPGPAYRPILAALLKNLGGGAKLVPDAHLAALAIEHGLTLCSADGDFARFKNLRWLNPLAR